MDFGLAKIIEPEGGEGLPTGTILRDTSVYGAGAVQSARAAIRTAMSIRSVIFYEMLSGDIPFVPTPTRSFVQACFRTRAAAAFEGTFGGDALAALVHRMLGKDTESRPSVGEVAAELQQLQASASISTAALECRVWSGV